MAKKRRPSGSRRVEKRMVIVCEGAFNKSEYAYLSSLIKSLPIAGARVSIELGDTKKNTGKELVREVIRLRDVKGDTAWVVYDKDGYTFHPETFQLARQKDVRIAFSAISFEMWILLHFEKTSKAFDKSEDIIRYLKRNNYIDYSKNDRDVFERTKHLINDAKSNAKWLSNYQEQNHKPDIPVYEYDSYSNLYELIENMDEFIG